jgi:hypothetical protein
MDYKYIVSAASERRASKRTTGASSLGVKFSLQVSENNKRGDISASA